MTKLFEQNAYAMDLLCTANKAVQKAVRINGKERVRTLRAQALDNLSAEVVKTFKGVELSDAFKQYANVLLVADCIKSSKKAIINAYGKTVMDVEFSDGGKVFTSEDVEVARSFFTNVTSVAYSNVISEVKDVTRTVERELLENINTGKVLGVDFSKQSHEFKLALFGGKTVKQFNELVKALFSTTLNKEDIKKKVLDQASMACRYVLHNLVFNHDEEISWETKKSLVDGYYKSSNESNYQTRFEKLQNVAYCIKGALMQSIEAKYNSVVTGGLSNALDNATSEN